MKKFWQEKDIEKLFYDLDDTWQKGDVNVVKGEMNKLLITKIGFRNCVNIPDETLTFASTQDLPFGNKGIKYLWNYIEYLKKVSHINYANEVLMYLRPQAQEELFEKVKLYPISGLFNFRHSKI